MPAEANLFSSEISFLSQHFQAVVFSIGVILHEVFDIIEVLVYPVDVIWS
jgi:hypothetical protein